MKCKCNQTYVGKATQLNTRMNNHRNHIRDPQRTILPADRHLRECGDTYEVTILFILENQDSIYLDVMEDYFIYILDPELNVM